MGQRMPKRIYCVADKVDLSYRMVNASSQVQAIAHVVKSRYVAKAADVAGIVAALTAEPPINVEEAGEE